MTKLKPVPVSNFDTNDIDPRHRFDAWQENIGIFFDVTMSDHECHLTNFFAQIDVYDLQETVFGVTRSQAQQFLRHPRRVIDDDMDHILVQLFLQGGGLTKENERIVAGDMLIIDLSYPHDMITGDFENLTLVLPRELRPDISDTLAPLHGLKLSKDNPIVRFMTTGFLNLWKNIPDMTAQQAVSAVQGTLGLMQGCLLCEGLLPEEIDTPTSVALAKVIYRYIDANLAENITPASLALTFRMSRTHIYRIFAPHGGVANYLWDRRLQRSFQLLSQQRYSHKNIGSIAFECGFNSESHFSRAFRAKFHSTPSQTRADAVNARLHHHGKATTSTGYAAGLPNWVRRL
ncbi:helix-turn-helix domain-containing protein [Thalassospira xianhensis]|uniref:AraC family transcriptional regulator n=1 Tax=Thalassospira xianhensis MCCC 1A02616 TaxID=1177929 RepID=A0A367UA31_9PROT|nr:helix-turn-helix domain-containing protein [Thalassospira xianhensis]RCK05166.1 AraC family transcriptional regulator [Thalassospira xianhensis MCCC 1A02616]